MNGIKRPSLNGKVTLVMEHCQENTELGRGGFEKVWKGMKHLSVCVKRSGGGMIGEDQEHGGLSAKLAEE